MTSPAGSLGEWQTSQKAELELSMSCFSCVPRLVHAAARTAKQAGQAGTQSDKTASKPLLYCGG